MKLTKRMKSAIIQASIANVVFLLVLLGIIGLLLVPKILEIESVKSELGDVYSEYNDIKTKGISFQDLKSIINREGIGEWDEIDVSKLLSSVTSNFYSQNFSNTWSEEYVDFLKEVEARIVETKTSKAYIEQDQKLNTILPVYSPDNSFQDDSLTDFHFINYVENLIYTFNLSVKWQIGVWNIEKVGGSLAWENPQNTYALWEDIFQIPMRFEVEWQKSDIVDFIHFFQNVGSINLEWGNLEIYDDKFIAKVIEWEERTSDYNIYENQISDIQFIDWGEYPDSSTSNSAGTSLIAALKWSQAREKASVEVNLSFYVAGVPWYRMEKYIKEVLDDYAQLSSQVAGDTQKYTSQAYSYKEGKEIQSITQLQNLNALLVEQKGVMEKLQMALARKENIQKTYEDAISYDATLKWIEQSYENQILNLSKK